jgi:hypothetical protein
METLSSAQLRFLCDLLFNFSAFSGRSKRIWLFHPKIDFPLIVLSPKQRTGRYGKFIIPGKQQFEPNASRQK